MSCPFGSTMEDSVEEVVDKWLTQHREGTLTVRSFREYWRTVVPQIYAPQPNVSPLDTTERDEQAVKLLFNPLHMFITNNLPKEQVYNSIRELDAAPSLCGRIFNSGEPTYGCRDCGFDPTCVLCSDCFKASPHTRHRYKMSTSSGGGYCDCGDTEAWRSDAFCEVHAKGQPEVKMCSHKLLEPALVSRMQIVMELIIEYAMHMLTQSEGLALPKDLDLPDAEPTRNPNLYQMRDSFCAVLHNDESHTYEQVINALERSIKCTKKEAVAYVTFIDREGRCVIRCSGLQACKSVKEAMDKQAHYLMAKPFIIKIFRAHVQAHQAFASDLLSWLDSLLEHGNAIKSLFGEVIFTQPSGDSLTNLERIMSMDNELCKASRIQWHKLFIAGLLLDLETKRKFARLFVKHYSKMMKMFIADDHEHSVCIVSLGVQLFTMPTIAHMLIAEEAVIAKLILTFFSECHSRIINGKLYPLSQNSNMQNADPSVMTPAQFKRVQFVLFDLKYLLGMVPTTWTEELKKGFLHGFSQIVKLFVVLQNMDPVTRKEGTHVEFEQEWEGSFNLHIKMSPIIPQIVEWAASDRVVLVKCMRILLHSLAEHGCEGLQKRFMREAAGQTVSCIEYDVSKSPVSMHVPLTRLWGFLALQLQLYNLNYNSPEFTLKDKPSLKEIIEPSLRTLVLVAQCKAGMWRRNGMSLSNQVYFYRNVRCRQEMMDKDVLVLQIAASLMPPNEFLITMLNRFALMSWQRVDYESAYMWNRDDDNGHQTVIIMEEFLQVLLYILAERYTVGVGDVTQDDITKHEVIHLLCINHMTHSTINKYLPEGVNHETGMERVIDEIAEFKKSPDEAKGFYQLKEKYYPMYNNFFYHYSKEEQSKSEVQQRSRCKKLGMDEPCSPPPPPPEFTPSFKPILQIINCDVFRHLLMRMVNRWCDGRSQSVTETCLQVSLHILGVGCHEEARQPGFLSEPDQLLALVHQLQNSKRSASFMPLINWTFNKLVSVRPSMEACSSSSHGSKERTAEDAAAAASEAAVREGDLKQKMRKAEQALARKKRILANMANLQKSFMKNYSQSNTSTEVSEDSTMTADDSVESVAQESMEVADLIPQEMVALGPRQTLPKDSVRQEICILCHQHEHLSLNNPSTSSSSEGRTDASREEESDLAAEGGNRQLVLGVMVQASTVLTRRRTPFSTAMQPLYLPADLHRGIHVSSCGHPMHVDCWKTFYSKLIQKEQRRNFRIRQPLPYDIERSEYLCPMCESVCNDAVPLLPPPTQPVVAGNVKLDVPDLSPQQWLQGLNIIVQNKSARSPKPSPSMPNDDDDSSGAPNDEPAVAGVWMPPSLSSVVSRLSAETGSTQIAENFVQMFSSQYNIARPPLLAGGTMVMWDLAHSIFMHGLDQHQNPADERVLGSVLAGLAYTLRCREEVHRFEGRALLTGMSDRDHMFLSALTASAAYTPSTVTEKQSAAVSTSACVSLLTDLLGCGSTTLLEMDAFSAMVSLVLMLPTLFSTTHATAKGGLQDQYVMQLCFFGHILQLLLTYDVSADSTSSSSEGSPTEAAGAEMAEDESMDTDQSSSGTKGAAAAFTAPKFVVGEGEASTSTEADGQWLQQLLLQCREVAGLPRLEVSTSTLLTYIKDHCLPFLRCCGLFFHLLTGSSAPAELRSSVWVPESEYYCLLRYLGLSTSLCQSLHSFSGITQKWLSHPRLRKCLRQRTFDGHKVLQVNTLTPLAADYSELINDVTNFTCPSSTVGEKSSTPTICLVCGSIMCSQTYCCQSELRNLPRQVVGSTTHHAYTCSAGSTIFLRVPDCRVILRTGKFRGCYIDPPYLDRYGETDLGLRRGNPLFLNTDHYKRMHLTWLKHEIPELVCRTLATSQTYGQEWQNL